MVQGQASPSIPAIKGSQAEKSIRHIEENKERDTDSGEFDPGSG